MNWKEIRFGKLYAESSRNGVSKPGKIRGFGYKMINMGELFDNDRIYDIPMERVPLTENEKINAKIEKGDLLFARQSLVWEGAGKCSIVMEVSPLTVFESHLIRVRLNEKANPLFYFYYFSSSLSPIKSIVNQCAQAGIRGSELQKLKVVFPPKNEQNKISNILSTYDELIETNKKRIKILEQMAENLYKEWFVRFRFPGHENAEFVEGVPKGWEYCKLKKLLNISYGKDHKNLEDGDIPIFGSGGIMRYGNKALYDGEVVLIPRKGTLNNIMYYSGKLWTVDTMFYAVPQVSKSAKYIYYTLNKFDMESYNSGAALPSMTTAILYNLKILLPDGETLARFDEIIDTMFDEKKILENQNQNLIKQRDYLLPRLMSGKLQVK